MLYDMLNKKLRSQFLGTVYNWLAEIGGSDELWGFRGLTHLDQNVEHLRWVAASLKPCQILVYCSLPSKSCGFWRVQHLITDPNCEKNGQARCGASQKFKGVKGTVESSPKIGVSINGHLAMAIWCYIAIRITIANHCYVNMVVLVHSRNQLFHFPGRDGERRSVSPGRHVGWAFQSQLWRYTQLNTIGRGGSSKVGIGQLVEICRWPFFGQELLNSYLTSKFISEQYQNTHSPNVRWRFRLPWLPPGRCTWSEMVMGRSLRWSAWCHWAAPRDCMSYHGPPRFCLESAAAWWLHGFWNPKVWVQTVQTNRPAACCSPWHKWMWWRWRNLWMCLQVPHSVSLPTNWRTRNQDGGLERLRLRELEKYELVVIGCKMIKMTRFGLM